MSALPFIALLSMLLLLDALAVARESPLVRPGTAVRRQIERSRCVCNDCIGENTVGQVYMTASRPFRWLPFGIAVPDFGSAEVDSGGLLLLRDHCHESIRYDNNSDRVHVQSGRVGRVEIDHGCPNVDRSIPLYVRTDSAAITVDTVNVSGHIYIGCQLDNQIVSIDENTIKGLGWSADLRRGTFSLDDERPSTAFDVASRRRTTSSRFWTRVDQKFRTRWSRRAAPSGATVTVEINDRSVLRYSVNNRLRAIVWRSANWMSAIQFIARNPFRSARVDAHWHYGRREAIVTCGGVTTAVQTLNRHSTVVYDPYPSSHFAYWPFAIGENGKRRLAFRLGPINAMIDANF